MVVHLDEDVSAACELDDLLGEAAVAGIAHRPIVGIETKRETFEIRLHVRRVTDGHRPAGAVHDVAGVDLPHAGGRPPAGRRAAARLEDVDAALVLDAGADVRSVDAVLAEQLLGHARDRRRPVDLQVGNPVRALVPALQHQPPVVHAVVVVQMAEEDVRDVDRPMPALEQPMMGAGAVIENDRLAADLDEVAGALPVERRRWRSRAEQRNAHRHGNTRLRSQKLNRKTSCITRPPGSNVTFGS